MSIAIKPHNGAWLVEVKRPEFELLVVDGAVKKYTVKATPAELEMERAGYKPESLKRRGCCDPVTD